MPLPYRWLRSTGPFALLLSLLLLLGGLRVIHPSPSALAIEESVNSLPADGVSTLRITARAADSLMLSPPAVEFAIVEGARHARIAGVTRNGRSVEAIVRAGIEPGAVVVEARGAGYAPARIRFSTRLDAADRFADGTPDFLRLDNESDQQSFRRWFALLAEAQAFRPAHLIPAEINDCAALIRFAYREALREHEGGWASELALPSVPAAGSVEKYQYPFTPLGANLFRVRPGAFREEDLREGSFAQFADAQTIERWNTHLVSRDIRRARPGDLLFFRQLEQDLPFHSMIFLGRSQLEPGTEDWVIYHTGPLDGGKGEIRRVRVRELLQHPSPRWRPAPGNGNFLGVYRWNILADSE